MKRTGTRAKPKRHHTLHELQSLMQAAILDGSDDILSFISGNSRTDAQTLFGVYRNAYSGRLLEILANDYTLSRRFSGHERFEQIALEYIRANPSQTQNARWFGSGFPDYVASRATTIDMRALAELAAIEKALADAFDGVDGSAFALEELAQTPPEDWSRLIFMPHVSSRTLTMDCNAFHIWMTLKDDGEAPPPAVTGEQERLIVWRQANRPLIRALPYEEAMMWNEATKGKPFGVLCEILATYDDPENAPTRAATYLQGWLVSGLLASARLEPVKRTALQRAAVP